MADAPDERPEDRSQRPPVLVGMIKLSIPRIRRPAGRRDPDAPSELISDVAFDSEGRAWGLVVSRTPIPGMPRAALLDFERFVAFTAIPFRPDEIVTRDTWVEEIPADGER
jgi:hypothetical protein